MENGMPKGEDNMKANYIPLDKQSKKVQRAAARAHRTLWQGVKLCPRIMRKKLTIAVKGGEWNCRNIGSKITSSKRYFCFAALFYFCICSNIFFKRAVYWRRW